MESAERFGARAALSVDGRSVTYGELRESACAIAATLQTCQGLSSTPLTAVFARRGLTAFRGILGALLSGRGYVPIDPATPAERARAMFGRAACRSIVVDAAGAARLEILLDGADKTLVLLPECEDPDSLRLRWPEHRFLGAADLLDASDWVSPASDPDSIAYLLFTSGSTGTPKGVMVAHRNVTAFVDYMAGLYEVSELDRFSQMFQLTFDLSVFDMFVCWRRGAHLVCPSPKALLNPGRFISDAELTVWFSVPSTVSFMSGLGKMRPGAYPNLRLSLFCGEPLPVATLRAWREAAPNSIVENLYGPTELTVACTRFRWSDLADSDHHELGIAPIGEPFPGMIALVADASLREVDRGEVGELLMTGPQMSLGYLNDPERTAQAFVRPPGRSEIYYRTGDRVRRATEARPMAHLGRLDFQVKVLGHRVELGEIEAVIREESGLAGVVAVGWPRTESGFGGVEAFVEGDIDRERLSGRIAMRLPEYMAPRRIHVMSRLPRTSSDKLDRQALMNWLGENSERRCHDAKRN
ncbi:MAG: amino acid adenylation domain-containing protein [Caulobacteraceae bacterium]